MIRLVPDYVMVSLVPRPSKMIVTIDQKGREGDEYGSGQYRIRSLVRKFVFSMQERCFLQNENQNAY